MSIICAPAGVIGSASPSADLSLIGIITDLGLTTNLKLCLDAGDANSYDPGVQTAKWLDTSGNGYDFYRGTSTGGDGAEPTFNGSAGGLSSSEYWSFDGGDYFSYDTTNEAWMENLHKDNAALSFFVAVYPQTVSSSHRLFSTHVSDVLIGVDFSVANVSGAKFRFRVGNGSSNPLSISTSGTISTANWNILQGSINEATGAGGAILKIGSATAESFSSTYSSPSSGASAGSSIGAAPDGTRPLTASSRLACLAIWEGTALTSTNLTDLYDAIKGRFGL